MTTMLHTKPSSQVLDFEKTLHGRSTVHTPAAVTEAMLPLLDASRWLVVRSGALADRQAGTALKLILDRTAARGVSIAFDVDWQPLLWGLEPGSAPPTEVKRRVRPLCEAAMLIHCTAAEAEAFFRTSDPVSIHEASPRRPAVLVRQDNRTMRWCLAGRTGEAPVETDHDGFLEGLLGGLIDRPELLDGRNRGAEAIAAAGQVKQLLRRAIDREPALPAGAPSAS